MTPNTQSLDRRLGLNKYDLDTQSHIAVNPALCQSCQSRPCLTVCPARVYTWVDNRIAVAWENCLECGTCQISCNAGGKGGLTWSYPRGGFGIVFRYG